MPKMILHEMVLTLGLCSGLAIGAFSEEVIAPAVSVTTTSVVVPIAAVPTVPVAVRRYDRVAWKELRGTVQSVDRYNQAFTVQDRDGKDVQVAWNNRIRIYRQGYQIAYGDVEPQDQVLLQYRPQESEEL